jgi:hypothetical protein
MARPVLIFAALIALLSSCSMDTPETDSAVTHFHAQLNDDHLAEIYDASADELKQASTQKDFVEFLTAVHRKLGVSKSSEQQSWNVNYGVNGKFVTVVYNTTYANGPAAEQFVFRIRNDAALLAGYHINSKTLVLN